jgi:hypothetical protein
MAGAARISRNVLLLRRKARDYQVSMKWCCQHAATEGGVHVAQKPENGLGAC